MTDNNTQEQTSSAIVPARKRSKVERERDLPTITKLYIRGVPVAQIADALQDQFYHGERISVYSVANDIGIIRRRWIESTLVDFNEAKSRELAKLDELEKAYWDAWDKSSSESVTQEEETSRDDVAFPGGLVVPVDKHRVLSVRRPGSGNPMFLQGIERCIQKRCQILGLFSPEIHQIDWRVEARGIWSDQDINTVKERAVNLFMEAIERGEKNAEGKIDSDDIIEGVFSENE